MQPPQWLFHLCWLDHSAAQAAAFRAQPGALPCCCCCFSPARSVKAGGAFKKSEWGGAICDTMAPDPCDVMIQGKSGLCGFASTNLHFVLNQNGIRNVALAGFLVSRLCDAQRL